MPPPAALPCRRAARRRSAVIVLAAAALLAGCGSGAPSGVGSARPPATTTPTGGAISGSALPGPSGSPGPSGGSAGGAASAPVPSRPFDPAAVAVTLAPIVDGLEAPLAIVNAGDGSDRLFVAEQGGRIRIVDAGALVARPFLDISDRISSGGERGLLGVAFHPGYPADPRVFVDYTDRNGDTQVSSFTVDPADPDRLDPSSEAKLLFVKQPFANHNGGAVVFDPSGMLLISFGDGGSGGDPQGNGQSTRTLLGKIVRIDVDQTSGPGGRVFGIPADNPFASRANGSLPEIWLTGLRNPWRMSIDRATGDLWIGDVGQDAWEEIDVQRAGVPGGTNFGWNRMEGTHCYQPGQDCQHASLTLPVTDYGHDLGCTVVNGGVYRGTAQPALAGGYLFADYCTGRLWALDPTRAFTAAPREVGQSGRNLSAFGEDEAGELYAADIAGGAILRVTATPG